MTGIDYGMGLSNIDHATGIRYGVISQRTPNPDAIQDIYHSGEDLTYKAAVDDAKSRIAAALTDVLDDMGVLPFVSKHAPRAVDAAKQQEAVYEAVDAVWETIEQDFNDQYESDENTLYRFESDGYILETSSLGIYVIKSPYYTHAAFCSPCCPGAGDLNTPAEGGAKTYCLGAEWFEGGAAPYPVFPVEGK